MIGNSILGSLRQQLVDERQERLLIRQNTYETWRTLFHRETEAVETAQKVQLSMGLGQQEDSLMADIGAIDAAVAKMSTGQYGECEVCGEDINIKRLEAIPWTQFCIDCARAREKNVP